MESNRVYAVEAPARSDSAVIISVPHAGRNYPDGIEQHLSTPLADLIAFEDRHADALAAAAVNEGATLIRALVPRLWIDLNRELRDLDPSMIQGGLASNNHGSARMRAGLGLIPKHLPNGRPVWRDRLEMRDVNARIRDCYHPYHGKLRELIGATADRFGCAVLVDLHSMPPLARRHGRDAPEIVIGDAYGKSAPAEFGARVAAVARAHNYGPARNWPYAGGHITQHYGAPAKRVFAIQIEIDRTLYLDPDGRDTGGGLAEIQRFVADAVRELDATALASGLAEAAE